MYLQDPAVEKASYGYLIKAGAVSLLLVLLYFQVMTDLADAWWNDAAASHGFLVPPLAMYLAWLERKSILAKASRMSGTGLWFVALGCIMFLVGRLGAEFFLTRISLLVVLTGLIWTFWGPERLKKLSFPLLLLATMVPLPAIVWNALAAPLQLFASDVATTIAQTLGVAVYRDGNIIHLANISLGVAEACSGLHSLSALMITALLLGFLQCTSVAMRVLLFALSIPMAIALNVVRITGTAVLADYWQDIAFGFYHSFSGWLIFVLGFAGLWLITRLLKRFERKA